MGYKPYSSTQFSTLRVCNPHPLPWRAAGATKTRKVRTNIQDSIQSRRESTLASQRSYGHVTCPLVAKTSQVITAHVSTWCRQGPDTVQSPVAVATHLPASTDMISQDVSDDHRPRHRRGSPGLSVSLSPPRSVSPFFSLSVHRREDRRR